LTVLLFSCLPGFLIHIEWKFWRTKLSPS
jgi:hypothetical protein